MFTRSSSQVAYTCVYVWYLPINNNDIATNINRNRTFSIDTQLVSCVNIVYYSDLWIEQRSQSNDV